MILFAGVEKFELTLFSLFYFCSKGLIYSLEKFRIIKPSKKDASGLVNLIDQLAKSETLEPPSVSAKKRLIRDVFESKRLRIFLAFVNSTPVGYASYFFTYSSFLARPILFLEDIFVLKEQRGKGIGHSLLMSCVREAVKNNCGRMEWTVLNWNSKAIRFYEKNIGARRLKEWYLYRLDRKELDRLGDEGVP